MKLEVGMYVRTKKGLIAKYIGYEKDEELDNSKYIFDGKIYWYYEYYNDYVYEEDFKEWYEETVVKVSNNIIDLIEVGDYVNGYKVDEVDYAKYTIYIGNTNKCIEEVLWSNDIKSIVTKEQFESMSYKVDK